MAGSGKTTFLQRLNAHMHEHSTPGYIINLDPAVMNLPYSPNVDIRDTVRRERWQHFSSFSNASSLPLPGQLQKRDEAV